MENTEKGHIVFIVNPRSGTDRSKAMKHVIESRLDLKKYTYEIQHTSYAGHGTELAKTAATKGAYCVVAVGGDGSVNDVAAGLSGTQTILGIVPKGSGNGMARTMGLPIIVEDALEVINKGNIVRMDLGYVAGRMFISNAGVGFDALISKKFAKSKRRGLAIYSWLVTKYLWLYKESNWRITIDGEKIQERAFMVNVANGHQLGYNFSIVPHASYTDGWLDVTVIKKFPKMMIAGIALNAMKGNIGSNRFVRHYKAKEVTISHPDLQLMQIDGDAIACGNKITFRVEPAALQVLVP
jgi:YegS/Rv2252/BmrU family lipid kinase